MTFAWATHAGCWDLAAASAGLPRLRGRAVGLVGFGNIARALLPKAHGFGLRREIPAIVVNPDVTGSSAFRPRA